MLQSFRPKPRLKQPIHDRLPPAHLDVLDRLRKGQPVWGFELALVAEEISQ